MSINQNRKLSTNNLISKLLESLPKVNTTIDQQDNESLNTMDYYNEDNSSKNQNLEENKFSSKSILRKNSKSKTIPTDFNTLDSQTKTYNNQKISELYKNKNFCLTRPTLTNIKDKNVLNCFEDIKTNNDYCSKCNLEIEYSTNACPHCLMPICSKCLKEIFNRNLDNNDDLDNHDQGIVNKKKCPNCRNLTSINDYIIIKPNTLSGEFNRSTEPQDSCENDESSTSINPKDKNAVISKDLENGFNEYESLLNKIEEKKKEIETKKNLNFSILQIIKKSIEFEYNTNLNKLNEMILKLKKIKKSLIDQKNIIINKHKNYNCCFELQRIIEEYKCKLNNFSKTFEKLNQRFISRPKPKAYKSYESKILSINMSDTYCMKYKEILSNQYIGNTFIKVDRYVNNYINYINFSILIRQKNKDSQNNNNNNGLVNKPKYAVNMIVNNKIFKLNKSTKDNNQQCFNYECSLEENSLFSSKNQPNSNNNIKKDEFNIKVVVTELFL